MQGISGIAWMISRYGKLVLAGLLQMAVLLGGGHAQAAEPLPMPQGPVILSVTGSIGVKNSDDRAVFDMETLGSLPTLSFRTSTIWTDGVHKYTGVPLRALLDRLDAGGAWVVAHAINDYSVRIPMSTIMQDTPIIAFLEDGREMSRRERGPLWIIYPFDASPEFRSEVIYSKSVWQLERLDIVP